MHLAFFLYLTWVSRRGHALNRCINVVHCRQWSYRRNFFGRPSVISDLCTGYYTTNKLATTILTKLVCVFYSLFDRVLLSPTVMFRSLGTHHEISISGLRYNRSDCATIDFQKCIWSWNSCTENLPYWSWKQINSPIFTTDQKYSPFTGICILLLFWPLYRQRRIQYRQPPKWNNITTLQQQLENSDVNWENVKRQALSDSEAKFRKDMEHVKSNIDKSSEIELSNFEK